jgi:hypothetical protein
LGDCLHLIHHYSPDGFYGTAEQFKYRIVPWTDPLIDTYFPGHRERNIQLWDQFAAGFETPAYEGHFYNDLDALGTFYEKLVDISTDVLEAVNSLMILHVSPVDFNELVEDHPIWEDLYRGFAEHIENEDFEAFSEALLNEVEPETETLVDKINASKGDLSKLKDFDAEELADRIFLKFTNQLFYQDFPDELWPLEEGEHTLQEIRDEFIDTVSAAMAQLQPKTQKQAKQFSLLQLPCPFRPGEYIDYLRYIYDNSTEANKKHILAIISEFRANSYLDRLDRQEQEDEHAHED